MTIRSPNSPSAWDPTASRPSTSLPTPCARGRSSTGRSTRSVSPMPDPAPRRRRQRRPQMGLSCERNDRVDHRADRRRGRVTRRCDRIHACRRLVANRTGGGRRFDSCDRRRPGSRARRFGQSAGDREDDRRSPLTRQDPSSSQFSGLSSTNHSTIDPSTPSTRTSPRFSGGSSAL